MTNIDDLSFWRSSLGLLPIKHFSSVSYPEKYIMLNGNKGDFCLDISQENTSREFYFSSAWSSNTKNYVAIQNDKVALFNWKENKEEHYSANNVLNNMHKFHRYLTSKSLRSDSDIVPFVLNIFKSLRSLCGDRENSLNSIQQLLCLLATAKDGADFDRNYWGIDQNFTMIPELNRYLESFNGGVSGKKPNLDLVIRHSLGKVFQEAQRFVLRFNDQYELFSAANVPSSYPTMKRRYSSIHHTPSFLARSVVENALDKIDLANKSSMKIFDPCCGSSEFLFEALKQLKELSYGGEIEIVGWDSSQVAIATSKFLLTYENRSNWANKVDIRFIPVEDSLKEDWASDYDLILMNPPFVSWKQSNSEDRDSIRESLNNVFSGSPNQASAFFYKAINSLNEDGVIGTVIPSSLLWLDSYKKLRKETNELLTIDFIGRLGNYIFEDAFTDASIMIAHKPKEEVQPYYLWTNNQLGVVEKALNGFRIMMYNGHAKATEDSDFSIYRPELTIQDDWKPIPAKDYELYCKLQAYIQSGFYLRVGDVFSVKQGIRSGNNKIFSILSEHYEVLPNHEKKFFKLAIDNDSISRGKIKTNNYFWYPYGSDGLLILSEQELKEKVRSYYMSVLAPNKEMLMKRPGINKTRWWSLSRPRNWLMTKQPKIVSAEFGNSNSFAFDFEGEYVFERGYGWLLNKNSNDSDYYFYMAVFTSAFFGKLLSIYSKQLAGGNWYDLSNKYVKDIPIPVLTDDVEDIMKVSRTSSTYKLLSAYGKRITMGPESAVKYPIIEESITTLIYKFWQLS
jgi:adenine-specific DNA-methyltransferase